MLTILDNSNNKTNIDSYSLMPNGDKYVTFEPEGVYILRVACLKDIGAIWKAYKPTFRQSNYFDNMTEAKKTKLVVV